jgi:chaperonin GroES
MTVPYTPTGDKMFIKILDRVSTRGGLILPDQAHGCDVAEVLAIGPGRYDFGVLIPTEVDVGDKIVIDKKYTAPIVIEGVTYTMMEAKNVIAYY